MQDASAAPKYLRLSYTGNTATTMTVAWNTDAEEDTEVRFGVKPGQYTTTVPGTSFKATAGLGYVHEVTLTGLEPSTVYYYVAGSAAQGYTAASSFKTGPVEDESCGALTLSFLGDNRPDPTFGGGQNWPKILDESVVQKPDFVLNGGDLVIVGDKIDQWNSFLGATTKVASKLPFMPCIGNHDNGPGEGDTANYNQLFALPRSEGTYGSGTEDYYFFTYANAIIVVLSTEGFEGGATAFGNQAAWLDEILTSNPKKWKIVYYHKPSYTNKVIFDISHAPNEAGQNAALVSVIDKHHVDLVFTSHNHWYERFEPTACGNQGKAGSDQPCPVGAAKFDKGTVYAVSGGAGAFTIPGLLCGSLTGRAKCSGDHHYIIVSINNETLSYQAWSAYPQASAVMDSFTITKGADICTVADGGTADAGGDSGPGDASTDAGADARFDSGSGPDASGQTDAATLPDGAASDAAVPEDAGPPDAETEDGGGQPGGDASGGDSGDSPPPAGCGCHTADDAGAVDPALAVLLLAAALLLFTARWKRQKSPHDGNGR
jgi:hypothetical protein